MHGTQGSVPVTMCHPLNSSVGCSMGPQFSEEATEARVTKRPVQNPSRLRVTLSHALSFVLHEAGAAAPGGQVVCSRSHRQCGDKNIGLFPNTVLVPSWGSADKVSVCAGPAFPSRNKAGRAELCKALTIWVYLCPGHEPIGANLSSLPAILGAQG